MSVVHTTFFVCDHCGKPCNEGVFPSDTRPVEYLPDSQFRTLHLAFCEVCANIDTFKNATVLATLKEIHRVLQSTE